VRVVKTTLRVARVGSRVFERGVVGAINIGLRLFYLNEGPVALASTGAHEVRATLVIPHEGATSLDCLQLIEAMRRCRRRGNASLDIITPT
jgi:hypothetical protein